MPDITNVSPLTPHSPMALGAKIDAYFALKTKLTAYNSAGNKMKELLTEMERDLIHALDNNDLTGSQGHNSRCSITETEVPQVDDMDAVYAYIEADFDNRRYLLQRRVSSTAFKEIKQITGEAIPGLSDYTKRAISIRKLS
jgi:hypothetical protein